MQKEVIGYVNKIIDSSYVDGYGNRTAIFFQGCNFNCFYCHNPETIRMCNNCGICVNKCPSKALKIDNAQVIWDAKLCIDCDNCVKICPNLSSPKILKMTATALCDRIRRNAPFIDGITTSGGECTIQSDFLLEFYKLVHRLKVTIYTDTNGAIDFSDKKYKNLLNETDGFLLDIKAFDNQIHKKITKHGNEIVLKNLELFIRKNKLIELRTVVLSSYPNKITIKSVCEILKKYDYLDVLYKIIAYRPFGVRRKFADNYQAPSLNELNELKTITYDYGLRNVLLV